MLTIWLGTQSAEMIISISLTLSLSLNLILLINHCIHVFYTVTFVKLLVDFKPITARICTHKPIPKPFFVFYPIFRTFESNIALDWVNYRDTWKNLESQSKKILKNSR